MKRRHPYLIIFLTLFLMVACQPSVKKIQEALEETQSVISSLTQTKTDKPTSTEQASSIQTQKPASIDTVEPTDTPEPTIAPFILYHNDFSEKLSGFPEIENERYVFQYSDGKYLMSSIKGNYVYSACAKRNFDDVVISVDAKIISDDSRSSYITIKWRHDSSDNSEYTLFVNGEDDYILDKRIDFELQNLREWDQSKFIRAKGQVNNITIANYGNTSFIYINDHFITQLMDDSLDTGDICLGVSSSDETAEVTYDNLLVYSFESWTPPDGEIDIKAIAEEMNSQPSKNEVDGAEIVLVPRGEFLMGSEDPVAKPHEAPEHMVYLDSFWIYKYEVTNAQFAAFLNAEGNQSEGGVTWLDEADVDVHIHQLGGRWVPDETYEDHPVVQVSWYGAVAYCQWAGGRLPTEAEWEKTARGADGRTYPWGNNGVTGSKANYCDKNCPKDTADSNHDDGYARTAPVGRFPKGASHYGAQDMAGNVWEWVADWYDGSYYSQPGNTDNPQGPPDGDYKIMRGGSWDREENLLRSSYRGVGSPDGTYFNTGFRCVLDQNN